MARQVSMMGPDLVSESSLVDREFDVHQAVFIKKWLLVKL
jgi:hypothetical protein